MNKKKGMLFLILSIMFVSLFSVGVSAQTTPQGPLGAVFDTISGLLEPIVTPLALLGSSQTDVASKPFLKAVLYGKILIGLLLIFVMYFALNQFMSEASNGIKLGIPIIIALMSVAVIPGGVIQKIFQSYSIVVMLLVWFVPIAAIWYINHEVFKGDTRYSHFGRFVTYALLVFLLGDISPTLQKKGFGVLVDSGVVGLLNYISLLWVVVVIGALWNLFRLISPGTGARVAGAAMSRGGIKEGWRRLRGVTEQEESAEKATRAELTGFMGARWKRVKDEQDAINHLTQVKGLLQNLDRIPEGERKTSTDQIVANLQKVYKDAESEIKNLKKARGELGKLKKLDLLAGINERDLEEKLAQELKKVLDTKAVPAKKSQVVSIVDAKIKNLCNTLKTNNTKKKQLEQELESMVSTLTASDMKFPALIAEIRVALRGGRLPSALGLVDDAIRLKEREIALDQQIKTIGEQWKELTEIDITDLNNINNLRTMGFRELF